MRTITTSNLDETTEKLHTGIIKTLTYFFLYILPWTAFAQEDPGLLTLDRIFNSSEFRSGRASMGIWLADGSGYTTLESSEPKSTFRDIVKYIPSTGVKEILVPAQKLIPEGKENPLDVEGYSWSPDGKKLLVFTNSQRVWRQNTRGDYWVFDLGSGKLFQLGKDLPESSLMFAKISPDGTKAAYVSKNNLYSEDLSTGNRIQLTFDGSTTLINGTFDWVYEEEFDCRDGFRWSPDSKSIAYWQLDASGVRDFLMINTTDSLYPFTIPVQYPKAGQVLSECKVGVISASGGKTLWMKLPGDMRNNYVPRMDWAASSTEIVLQYIPRLQNSNTLYLGNSSTGELTKIITETDAAWLDPVDDFLWLQNGKYFTWVSERTGWKHLYLISRNGKEIKPVTQGEFDIITISTIDEKSGYVYYMASPESPVERYLWRMKLSGKGKPEQLTPVSFKGSNSYSLSPIGNYAFHSYSNVNSPRELSLIDLPGHKILKQLSDNAKLNEKLSQLKRSPIEYFNVMIDDTLKIYGWMMKPYNFDPAKKYPVLFYVYGEPAGSTSQNGWGGTNYLWHLMLAQKGYIIITMDTRGTPMPRGRDWRKACYMKMGVLNSYEQAMAAKEVSKWSFVDPSRLAIWGWSGGGSSTLNAMFRYPDVYTTGMAIASVPDLRLYDAIYQERYLRTPEEYPEVYHNSSPMNFAQGLKGNLLIIHGTGDDNVHYQGVERLINELVKYNKQFDLMIYPNRSHGIYEGKGTTLHLYTLLTNYLLKNVEAGGK